MDHKAERQIIRFFVYLVGTLVFLAAAFVVIFSLI